jgi:uncharacterized membrane protein
MKQLASRQRVQQERAGYWIGFAMGGFFDGIVLHQILQWHHLLSGVDSGLLRDIGMQILADGLFHALMYLIAAIGLWKLFRPTPEPASRRVLLANCLIGFGCWHVLDSVLSHWILGIHRIRMDAENPLLWDIGWLLIFGLGALAAGMALRRAGGNDGPGRHGGTPALLALIVITAAWLATFPLSGTQRAGTVIVVLRPDISPARFLDGVQRLDARIIWAASGGNTWALKAGANISRLAWYRHGALYVSGALTPAGCAPWMTPGSTRTL